MSQSGEDEPRNLSGLPPAKLDEDIFKSLPLDEKKTLLELSLSGSNNKSCGSSGDSDPDAILSYDLSIVNNAVFVNTNYQNGETSEELFLDDAIEGLVSKAPTFWSRVTKLLVYETDTTKEFNRKIDLILQSVTNLASFVATNRSFLVNEFQDLFNRNQETLTYMMILECGGNWTGSTKFDCNWISNCSALETLFVLTNSDSVKNLTKTPVGIKTLISTAYASQEDLVWIAENCNKLETLIQWEGVDDGQDNEIDVNVLKSFLNAPKLSGFVLLIKATDPERLEESLEGWEDLCDSIDRGITAEVATSDDFQSLATSKPIHFVFSCSIDRKFFKGI